MKIKSIFLTFMAVLAFSACNNEQLGSVPDIETGEKVEGYLILNLENPVKTRTSGPGNAASEDGVGTENVINDLTIVFADGTGNILAVAEPGVTSNVSDKIKIEIGTYYLYALVNNTVDVKVGQNIERVIAVAEAKDATSGYKNGSFFMVNAHHNGSGSAGVEATIVVDNTIDNPAKADIFVDRVACKITDLTTSPNVSVLSVATDNFIDGVVVEGFALLNVNKQFNLIQTWNDDNGSSISLNDEEVLSTPLYPGGVNDLVSNQYFLHIGEYTELEKYGDGNVISITDKTAGTQNIFIKGSVYATENRPTIVDAGVSGLTAGRGETTGVIYKVQAKKGGINKATFYKYKDELYDNLEDLNLLTEFVGQDLELIPNSELRTLGIKVYENGVMYYTYFIRDPNQAYQFDGKNYYGVFRNSSYKLTIENIKLLGDDVPGGAIVDPDKPGDPGNPLIDTVEAYIEVTIKVNQWVVNEIGIDF